MRQFWSQVLTLVGLREPSAESPHYASYAVSPTASSQRVSHFPFWVKYTKCFARKTITYKNSPLHPESIIETHCFNVGRLGAWPSHLDFRASKQLDVSGWGSCVSLIVFQRIFLAVIPLLKTALWSWQMYNVSFNVSDLSAQWKITQKYWSQWFLVYSLTSMGSFIFSRAPGVLDDMPVSCWLFIRKLISYWIVSKYTTLSLPDKLSNYYISF